MIKYCLYCGEPAEGNYSIHRDGFDVGPQVPLCDMCGKYEHPSLRDIWRALEFYRQRR